VHFGVQLAKQEYFDLSTGFLLPAIQAGGKNHGVVAHQYISFIKIIHDILKDLMLDLSGVLVDDHQPGFIAVFGGIESNKVVGKFKFEFG
jgi:hypothetical protein